MTPPKKGLSTIIEKNWAETLQFEDLAVKKKILFIMCIFLWKKSWIGTKCICHKYWRRKKFKTFCGKKFCAFQPILTCVEISGHSLPNCNQFWHFFCTFCPIFTNMYIFFDKCPNLSIFFLPMKHIWTLFGQSRQHSNIINQFWTHWFIWTNFEWLTTFFYIVYLWFPELI